MCLKLPSPDIIVSSGHLGRGRVEVEWRRLEKRSVEVEVEQSRGVASCNCIVFCKSFLADRIGTDAIWMDLPRNIVFSRVNGSFDTDLEKTIRLATHYCKTRRCDAPGPMHKAPQHMQTTIALQHTTVQHIAFDAPVPMHKGFQHMQNTIAQHKQRREKVTWNPQFTLCAQIENDSTLKRRRVRPSRSRAYFSPQRNLRLPEKTQCFVLTLAFRKVTWSWRGKKKAHGCAACVCHALLHSGGRHSCAACVFLFVWPFRQQD